MIFYNMNWVDEIITMQKKSIIGLPQNSRSLKQSERSTIQQSIRRYIKSIKMKE
jgi:hypothetical protein